MNLSFLPNLITLIRVILLIPLSIFLIEENYQWALIIFFIAGFSDALDGFLAKRFSWVSRFGAILDPIADKALLIISMAILTYNGKINFWLFLLVIARDIYIVAGAYFYHYKLGPYDMQPSNLSKINTFVQIFLVTMVLVSLGYTKLPDIFIQSLVWLTFTTTLISGIDYGWVWGKKYCQAMKQRTEQKQKDNNKNSKQGD